MLRFNRFFVSFGIALFMVVAIVAVVRGSGEPPLRSDWETVLSCLELNDLVEARLDRPENVGLYQRAFGNEFTDFPAERVCRDDHRTDIQKVFGWAFEPVEWLIDEVGEPQAEQARLTGWGDGFSEAITLPQGVYSATTTWEWLGTPITSVYGNILFDIELIVIGDDSNLVTTVPLNPFYNSYDITETTGEDNVQFEITSPTAKVFIQVSRAITERQIWASWDVSFKRVS